MDGNGSGAPPTKVIYIGHASVIMEFGSEILVADPVFSDRIARMFTRRLARLNFDRGTIKSLAGVLISHAHHDHLDYRSLREFGREIPIAVPWGVSRLLRRRGYKDIRELRSWEETTLGALTVTAVPARHFGGRLPLPYGSGYQGYVARGSKCIYFAGDTGFDAALFREIGRRFAIDVAVLPIAGYVFPWYTPHHMTAEDAVEAFRLLEAKRMVPMHFETFSASFEPLGEPRRRLAAAIEKEKLDDVITVLESGQHVVVD